MAFSRSAQALANRQAKNHIFALCGLQVLLMRISPCVKAVGVFERGHELNFSKFGFF
jgi:hypothetical protein